MMSWPALIDRALRWLLRGKERVEARPDNADDTKRDAEARYYPGFGWVALVNNRCPEGYFRNAIDQPALDDRVGVNRLDGQRLGDLNARISDQDSLLNHRSLQNRWGGSW